MALSITTIISDGSTTQFAIPFQGGYVSKDDVAVFVEGNLDGLGNQIFESFIWVNDSLIDIETPKPVGTKITISRNTDVNDPAVEFTPGTISSKDLNINTRQLLSLIQELKDGRLDAPLYLNLDFGGNRAVNLGDPIDADDAVNKKYADLVRNQTFSARDAAITAKNQSEAARDLSISARNASQAARDDSIQAQEQAEQARDDILEDSGFQTVVQDLTDTQYIPTVAQNINNVNLVGADIDNINSVADNEININKVVDNEVNINKVADNEININIVSANEVNINKVANIDEDVTAVASIDDSVFIAADNIEDINTCADNIDDIKDAASMVGFADFSALDNVTPADGDLYVIERDGFKRSVDYKDINVINTLPEKTTLVDNDLFGGEDSASDPAFGRVKVKSLSVWNYIKGKMIALKILPKTMLTENTEFTVHHSNPAADYSSFAAATLDILNKYYPKATDGGIMVEVKALTGHIETVPLLLKNGIDAGWLIWTSEDADVKVDPTGSTATIWYFAVDNCTMPTINTLFNMESKQNSLGENVIGFYFVASYGVLRVNTNSGFINCSHTGLVASRASNVNAVITNFSGAGVYGIHSQGSYIYFERGQARRGASNDPTDIVVQRGGMISTRSGGSFTGGTSQTVNTVTGNGIIFQIS